MKIEATELEGVLLVEPRVFEDARGWFAETWVASRYADSGIAGPFVQDNVSKSRRGTLRGLHLQNPHAQGKLVCALAGEIYDVAVDVRRGSPTFGRWVAATLSEANHRQLWIPAGFAHGFCVTSDEAIFHYKCTESYRPDAEMSVAWDDPDLAIVWPVADPILTEKDRRAPRLRDIAVERLPEYR
jgi:dTDP-4-dehydrorhamnose 3,5-epimerase